MIYQRLAKVFLICSPQARAANLVADTPPLVLAGVRVEDLPLRTLRGPDRQIPERLDGLDGRWSDSADRDGTNRRQVNRTIAKRLHYAIDTATDAGGPALGCQPHRKCHDQQQTHRLPHISRLPTIACSGGDGFGIFPQRAGRSAPNPRVWHHVRPGPCIKNMHALHNRARAGFDPGVTRV
jgi:hypothetical protein